MFATRPIVSRIARGSGIRIVALVGAIVLGAAPALAQDAAASAEAAYKDMEQTMGGVPSFMKMFPKAGVAGAWAEVKAIEFSKDTALTPKEKSLISLAVAAQIPCQYCIWADTKDAKEAGATDEEIAEAVTMAALTRHWSTIFNGLQVDFDTFKKEMGGEMAAASTQN
jgi:AhpD family alkylhydroperoxidase